MVIICDRITILTIYSDIFRNVHKRPYAFLKFRVKVLTVVLAYFVKILSLYVYQNLSYSFWDQI